MKLTTRPLTDRHWFRPVLRKRAQFTASWSNTLSLLEREVYAIQRASHDDPVLMMDIRESDLRLDGQVRASARPASPAVAIAFDSIRGPLLFRCDRYEAPAYGGSMLAWQCNVRAIALTLEALRTVDRYGATQSGEQYTGYVALEEGPTPAPAGPMTRERAAEVLAAAADPDRALPGLSVALLGGRMVLATYRKAVRATHPDHGGRPEDFQQVQEAFRLLGPTS